MHRVDVQKAIEKVESFGYSAGYLQPQTFLITEPKTVERPKMVPVSVYELEYVADTDDKKEFENRLNGVRKRPMNYAPLLAVT